MPGGQGGGAMKKVRSAGVVMLLALAGTAYSIVKGGME